MECEFHSGKVSRSQVVAEFIQADPLAESHFTLEPVVVDHGVHELLVASRRILLLLQLQIAILRNPQNTDHY